MMDLRLAQRVVSRAPDIATRAFLAACLEEGCSLRRMRECIEDSYKIPRLMRVADNYLCRALEAADWQRRHWDSMTVPNRRRALAVLVRHPELTTNVG